MVNVPSSMNGSVSNGHVDGSGRVHAHSNGHVRNGYKGTDGRMPDGHVPAVGVESGQKSGNLTKFTLEVDGDSIILSSK